MQPQQVKFQLQLQEIDNGILLMVPGETKQDQQSGQQLIVKLPQSLYCKDVDELCASIQRIWPRSANKIELLEQPKDRIVKR